MFLSIMKFFFDVKIKPMNTKERKVLIEQFFEEQAESLGDKWRYQSEKYYVAIDSLRGDNPIADYPTAEDFLLLVKNSNQDHPMVKLAWEVLSYLQIDADCEISDIKRVSKESYQYLFMQRKQVEEYVDSMLIGGFCGLVTGANSKVSKVEVDSVYEKSKALETLICHFLRGGIDTSTMNASELQSYMHQVGVALHNIPHNIDSGEPLNLEQLQSIDGLDPTSSSKEWGMLVENVASKFGDIPPKEQM
jgi:hypothetical protein